MKRVLRFDYSPILVSTTPTGGVLLDANITRVGVFEYTLRDGSKRRELRLPEEVFCPESLASFAGATVTDDHPPDMVTPETWKDYAIGHIDAPVIDGDYVKARVHINDGEALRKFQEGDLRECSCGYYADYVPGAGVHPEYGAYDGKQTRIRGNHLALGQVGWGRAGRNVRLRVDKNESLRFDGLADSLGESDLTHPPGESNGAEQMKETIDGVEYTVGTPEHLAALRNSAAKAKKDAADSLKASTDAKAEAEKEKARADAAEAKIARDKRELLIRILCRKDSTFTREIADKKDAPMDLSALVARALKILLPNYNAEGKTPEQLGEALEIAIGMAGGDPAEASAPADVEADADAVTQGEVGAEETEKPPVAGDSTFARRGDRADSDSRNDSAGDMSSLASIQAKARLDAASAHLPNGAK